jgi:hypothetical protein
MGPNSYRARKAGRGSRRRPGESERTRAAPEHERTRAAARSERTRAAPEHERTRAANEPSGAGAWTNPRSGTDRTNPNGVGARTNPSGGADRTNPSGVGAWTNPRSGAAEKSERTQSLHSSERHRSGRIEAPRGADANEPGPAGSPLRLVPAIPNPSRGADQARSAPACPRARSVFPATTPPDLQPPPARARHGRQTSWSGALGAGGAPWPPDLLEPRAGALQCRQTAVRPSRAATP